MPEAREVLDRLTAAMVANDSPAVAACYSEDAVAVTPDEGELRGRNRIAEYMRQFGDSFSDLQYKYLQKHDAGDVAIDEGYLIGTHTGPLPTPSGEAIPATGKQINVRSCDVATVEAGLITQHRIYFDQMEFLGQLGLLPPEGAGSTAAP
jgi:ketosteroid isomerase-like protein